MVRFAPHFNSFTLVREAVPRYRADGGSVTERFEAEDSDSASSPPPTVPDTTVPDPLDAPVPDPFEDADRLEELEEEIATLAAHIHAATHRLLILIAEFDRRRGWELGGHRSCAYWLSARTGIDLGAAREKVRTARALVGLPETGASMARGELSFSQVRALSRVATEENENDLLELARGCTTAQLERMVRSVRRGDRRDEAAMEKRRHESRTLSVFPDDDGMYVVKGRLPAEVGALLMRAVEAANDALYRKEKVSWPGADSEKKAAQRRADALGLLAERALAAGFGGLEGGGSGSEAEPGSAMGAGSGTEEAERNHQTTKEENGEATPIPISGTRAERFQVILHVEPDTLKAEGEPGRSDLEDGTRVSAETSRRLSCDCGLVHVHHAPDGSILNVGRKTRTIPPALRRALEVRDRGCRFPGCGLRFTDAHHIEHWAEGGETSLGNTLLLCRHHHRLVHEEGWMVDWWGPGRAVFFDPHGDTHFDGRWKPPDLGDQPVADLVQQNRRQGADPDGWTAGAKWKREADIPDQIYFRAVEALNEVRR